MSNTETTKVRLIETLRNEHGVYLTAECGKTSATVGITEWSFQVCCHNAANRAWRGLGRNFGNIHAALSHYRSPEMKAIILAADKLNS